MVRHSSNGHVPPGPKSHWLLGNLPEFRRDPLAFFSGCAQTYGDIARFHILKVPVYLVNRPEEVEKILSTNSRNFRKGRFIQALGPLMGRSLFTTEGAEWLRFRKANQPGFRRDRLPAFAEAVVECAGRMSGRWRDGDTIDIHASMNALTVQIAVRAFFGRDIDHEALDVGHNLHEILEHFSTQVDTGMLIPASIPTPANLRMKRAMARLNSFVDDTIRKRRASGERTDDLLSSLLFPDDSSPRLTDKELRDEVKTLLAVGNDTTASSLTWTWYLLSQHPQVAERLTVEIEAVVGDRNVTLDDLPRFRYAGRIVLESLRLYPPAWTTPRVSLEDGIIGGYPVRRGASITMSQWVMHRDPRYFPEPAVFNPDRWEGGLMERLPRFAYFPFSGGPRGCIGESFAMVEELLILLTIAQRFRLKLNRGVPVQPWPTLTLQPRGAVEMRLERQQLIQTAAPTF